MTNTPRVKFLDHEVAYVVVMSIYFERPESCFWIDHATVIVFFQL